MKELLKEGNVIILGAGMKVYAEIPEMFVYENTKLSSELTHTEVLIGKIYSNEESQEDDIKKTVNDIVKRIVEAFDRHNLKMVDEMLAFDFVRNQLPPLPENCLKIPEGEYLVIKTDFCGGGTGHGQHDIYPDGHNVTCKKLRDGKYDADGFEVSFYQSGSFTAMILPEELEVVRDMKMSVTFK